MLRKPSLCVPFGIVALSLTALAQPGPSSDHALDRASIRAHIEGIFDAFVAKDAPKLRATHADDWRGFLEGSRTPIRGLEEYMRAVDPGLKNPGSGMASWKITDYDTAFFGPDLAVVSFNADIEMRAGGASSLRILDVYTRRDGAWIQRASHTVTHPAVLQKQIGTQISRPAKLGPDARSELLAARESVWRAYFGGDLVKLGQLIPEEAIAISAGPGEWEDRAAVLSGSRRFAEAGGRLLRLEFPRTEIQAFGATAILYTTYLYELDVNGGRSLSEGRATEVFVRREAGWVNTGWHLDTVR